VQKQTCNARCSIITLVTARYTPRAGWLFLLTALHYYEAVTSDILTEFPSAEFYGLRKAFQLSSSSGFLVSVSYEAITPTNRVKGNKAESQNERWQMRYSSSTGIDMI
jgi:hypothetical protein